MNHKTTPATPLRTSLLGVLVLFSLATMATASEPSKVFELWPGQPPGDKGGLPEEMDTSKPNDQKIVGKPVIRLGNVSKPTLSFYPAPPDKNTGTTILVCPGGGYHILAMDLEGTEVCDWLNSIGVNAALLKYRVPRRPGQEAHIAPLQDAQRAMGLLRANASSLGIATNRIGALGFSAGGHLAATIPTASSARIYTAIDAADSEPSRPDFNVLIYAAYLVPKDKENEATPETLVTAKHPPTFLAMAEDDPVRIENATFYYMALKKAGVPAELHLYPTGGHGYGLRRSEHYVTTWPDRVADWMRSQGLLNAK